MIRHDRLEGEELRRWRRRRNLCEQTGLEPKPERSMCTCLSCRAADPWKDYILRMAESGVASPRYDFSLDLYVLDGALNFQGLPDVVRGD